MSDEDVHRSERMPRIAILGLPTLTATVLLGARLVTSGDAAEIDGSSAPAAAALTAFACAFVAAFAGGRRQSRPWLLIAASCLGWALWHSVELRASNQIGLLQDVSYLCLVTSLVAGVLMLCRFRDGLQGRIKLTLDTLPPAIALGVAVWVLSVGAFVLGSNVSDGMRVSAIVHGFGSVTLLVLGAAGVLNQRRDPTGYAKCLPLAAITILAIADAWWLHRLTATAPRLTTATSAAFGAGFLLLAIGAVLSIRRPEGTRSDSTNGGARMGWESQVPDAALTGLLILAGGQAVFGESVRYGIATTIAAALTMLAVVVTRQSIVLRRDWHLRREIGVLSTQIDGLISQVGRDPLTGLLNHTAIHERIDYELALGRDNAEPVAVALIDVDNFKSINDSLGHQAGDRVLRAVASVLTAACRGTDMAARYAGDEFMLLLPGLNETHAGAVCMRIAQEVRRINDDLNLGQGARVSLSVGVAVTHGCLRSVSQTVAVADAAMYDAKENGKDRVVVVNADTLAISDPESKTWAFDQSMVGSHEPIWDDLDRRIG